MSNNSKHLLVRPEADTETVEEVVARAKRGLVRIPVFQRGLRWGVEEVVALFDSIYRGYPIGSFLLRKGNAEAARLEMGPLKIDAPETRDALWVIDGQQRLTALTAAMSRHTPIPRTPDDPFVVYFDAAAETFHAPPKDGAFPDTWVPVAHLLDASGLSDWVFNWAHSKDARLRGVVFEAGTRLRQYRIPLYIVDTDDEDLLRDIFYRINNSGKPLRWQEVHDALFGNRGEIPSKLEDLADELLQVGMGRPDENVLLSCLLAFQGLDVTRNIAEHYRKDPDVLRDVVRAALPAIRGVLSFLRSEAEVPHLRLLPRSLPLVVLTRFFRLFPEPNYRTRRLLVRWTWRYLLGTALLDERTLLRRGISVIKENDAEGSTQELLKLVPGILPADLLFDMPPRFDARAAESRLALLGMTSLRPLGLDGEPPIDIPALIEARDAAAFRTIFPGGRSVTHSPANRVFLSGDGAARKELLETAMRPNGEVVLRSHGISEEARLALRDAEAGIFLEQRRIAIQNAVRAMGDRLAEWGANDRPTIAYLLARGEGGN